MIKFLLALVVVFTISSGATAVDITYGLITVHDDPDYSLNESGEFIGLDFAHFGVAKFVNSNHVDSVAFSIHQKYSTERLDLTLRIGGVTGYDFKKFIDEDYPCIGRRSGDMRHHICMYGAVTVAYKIDDDWAFSISRFGDANILSVRYSFG